MARVLITAFGPYGSWAANSSWLALAELTRQLPALPQITTRLYPVDYQKLCELLAKDLQTPYDVTLHLGQAPGTAAVHLESIALNVAGSVLSGEDPATALFADGPTAFQSVLPLADWAGCLQRAKIPAKVSFHAGTDLCNATLYLVHYLAHRRGESARSALIHLPLTPEQTIGSEAELPSLPCQKAAQAIQLILEQLRSDPGDS